MKMFTKLSVFLTISLCLLFVNSNVHAQEIGEYHALFIAIDNYNTSTWKPLNTPVRDANAIQKVLSDKYGFKTITNLQNEDATRAKIIEKLDRLTALMSPNDNLLIYFSGHGIEIGSDGYWVPYDAKSKERYELLATSEIKTAISSIDCKHVLIMVDACFSSTIFKTAAASPDNDGSSNYYDKMESLLSRQALTAGGLEPVPDGVGEHSVFAKYVLKFLDRNQKKNLSGDELYELIKYPVDANSPSTPQFGHLQNTGHEGGQFIFRVQKKKICTVKVAFEQGKAIQFESDGGVLEAKTNSENSRYVWMFDNKVINNSTASLNVKKSGKYTVTAIGEEESCFASATIDVSIGTPNIVVDILEGKKVSFTQKGKLNAIINGYSKGVSYEWKQGNFVVGKTSSIAVTESGTYTVIIKNNNGEVLGRQTSLVTIKNRVYKVQVGDNIERIARNFYGDPNKAYIIYNANPTIQKGDILKVGTEIVVPNSKSDDQTTAIKVGAIANFAPFSATNSHNGGMITDIVNSVFQKMGRKTDVNYQSINQLKGLTFSGRTEASYPMTKNAKDEALFNFSEPIYSTLTVFFAPKEATITDVEATMKKRSRKNKYDKLAVAVPINLISEQLIALAQKQYISIKPMKTYLACFEALKNGEVNLVAAPQIVGLVAIKENPSLNRKDFKILDKAIEAVTLHLVVSKEHPESEAIIESFDRTFRRLKESGDINKIIDTHIDLIQNNP